MAGSIAGTPPAAPVGIVKTGTIGIDSGGNLWFMTLSAPTYIATWTGTQPKMAAADENESQAAPDESQVEAQPEPEPEEEEHHTTHGRHGRRR